MSLIKNIKFFFIILVLFLFPFGLIAYSGNKIYYIVFTVLSTYSLISSFNNKSIAFETFFALLFWLGFWFKLTVQISFLNNQFPEGVGLFDYKPESFDKLINIVSVSIMALLTAKKFRSKFIFNYKDYNFKNYKQENCLKFYSDFRMIIFIVYFFCIFFFSITNYIFVFFQKGVLPVTILPLGLNNLINWLMMFGLTSFTAVLFFLEFHYKKNNTSYLKLGFIENFLSSVSILSRAMIFNGTSLIYGFYRLTDLSGQKTSKKFFIKSFIILLILFIISLTVVNKLRQHKDFPKEHQFKNYLPKIESIDNRAIDTLNYFSDEINQIFFLISGRWVGVEGLMAVIGNKEMNYKTFINSFSEKFDYSNSFYENTVKKNKFVSSKNSKIYTLYVPGIVAFLFYTNSVIFLFIGIFILCIACSIIEFLSFRFSHYNIIFSYVVGNVLAYRLAHFGYMPQNSFKLIFAIFFTIGLIYFGLNIINKYWK